jgi:general secretion pathway protein K
MKICYSKQQGVALILVLWVISLLTIMAGSFALSIRREASVIGSIRDNAEASAIARAGILIAQQMLLNPDKKERWLANGTVYPIEYADTEIRIKIYSEQGKININKGNKKLLKKLIKYIGLEDEETSKITDAILDWRDNNELVRLHGAEKDQYADEGLKYKPRNKPFQSIEELQLVLGLNGEIFREIESMITIYSNKGSVDKKSASIEVLSVLAGKTAEEQDKDTESSQEPEENGLFGSEKKQPATTTQGAFTVISEARLINGAKSRIKAIIKRQSTNDKGKPFLVLAWTKHLGTKESLFEAKLEQ